MVSNFHYNFAIKNWPNNLPIVKPPPPSSVMSEHVNRVNIILSAIKPNVHHNIIYTWNHFLYNYIMWTALNRCCVEFSPVIVEAKIKRQRFVLLYIDYIICITYAFMYIVTPTSNNILRPLWTQVLEVRFYFFFTPRQLDEKEIEEYRSNAFVVDIILNSRSTRNFVTGLTQPV